MIRTNNFDRKKKAGDFQANQDLEFLFFRFVVIIIFDFYRKKCHIEIVGALLLLLDLEI